MMRVLILVLAVFLISSVSASDYSRERRLSDQIVDAIFDGEPFDLNVNGKAVLAIEMESQQDAAKGSVIILHGRGFHPDWEYVVHPLRVGLAERGWNTLSVQMPVLDKEAQYFDYVPVFKEALPRIEGAIAHLRDKGETNIILIAHSCGVHMAMEWVRGGNGNDLMAFVGIGMGATDYQQPMWEPFPLTSLTIPVLDIYGEKDYPAVHRLAPERLSMIKQAGNDKSAQIRVNDIDHYWHQGSSSAVSAIADWLDTI